MYKIKKMNEPVVQRTPTKEKILNSFKTLSKVGWVWCFSASFIAQLYQIGNLNTIH